MDRSALGDVKVDPLVDMDPLIGRAIRERYRLFHKLGGGRSDNVYLAEELVTGNKVAVRVFPREIVCDPELLKQCWSDARFATASDPASIVRVYEVDRTDEGRVFIAMEYLEGDSLSEVLRREGPLEPGHAVRLASDIAHALASASKVGVSHGRLGPRNVVLVGPDQRVKVTGFGVARLRGAISSDRLIGLGLVAPEYIAPEQLKDGAASEATDVYALGAVLYTMLTGSAPVTAPRHGDAQANDPLGAPAAVRTLRPEVPAALDQLIMRAIEREPGRRQGIEELREGLRDLASSAIVESTSPSDGPELAVTGPRVPTDFVNRRPHMSKKLLVTGAAGLVAATVITLAVLEGQLRIRAKGPLPVTITAMNAQADRETPVAPEVSLPREAQPVPSPDEPQPVPRSPAARQVSPLWDAETFKRLEQKGVTRPVPPERDEPAAPDEDRTAQRANEERRLRAEAEATRRSEEGRSQRAEAEAARRAEEGRRLQAEAEAARRADEERRLQTEAEAARRAENERRLQAEAEAARRADEEQRLQAEAQAARDRAQASPPTEIARSAESPARPETSSLTPRDLARLRTQLEQRLSARGLLRVSTADRWGVTLEIAPSGEVTLSGDLRDEALYNEVIRLVSETPGVRDVKATGVRISEGSGSVRRLGVETR